MDNYVLVGKIVNTFGIKGELKVYSDFEYKDRVFQKNTRVFIGLANNYEEETITSWRIHKGFDLITLKNYSNINEILHYKNKNIYALRDDIHLTNGEYLIKDLIGFNVYDKEDVIGVVIDYELSNNTLLKVKGEKTFYIPLISEYILDVDINNKKIITDRGKELII